QVMKDWKVPALAVAIVKDGRVVYAQGYGYRDVKRGLKVTTDTLFAIGSCSKAFAGASLGILVDERKLEWDKPVRTYLPELTLYDDYATAHIRWTSGKFAFKRRIPATSVGINLLQIRSAWALTNTCFKQVNKGLLVEARRCGMCQ